MNSRTIAKITALMTASALIGAVVAFILLQGRQALVEQFAPVVLRAFERNSLYIMIGIALGFFIPETILYFKGKAVLSRADGAEDHIADDLEKRGGRFLNTVIGLNNVAMILNLMVFGMSFDADAPLFWTKLIVFLVITLVIGQFEITTIRRIQKHDSRLKGDPVSKTFAKDFFASMDEAEKLKAYQASYQAFQFGKIAGLGIILFTMLLRMTGFTGAFPIFVASLSYLTLIVPYGYFAGKNAK